MGEANDSGWAWRKNSLVEKARKLHFLSTRLARIIQTHTSMSLASVSMKLMVRSTCARITRSPLRCPVLIFETSRQASNHQQE